MNEFIVKNGLISQGNVTVSGSISTTSPVNLSGFATGSVLFTSGSAGVITGSSNLFWDNTNGRLGIGMSSPTFRLEVQGGDARFANGLTIGTAGSAGWQFSSNTVTLIQNGFIGIDVASGREFSFTNTSFSTTYLKLASVTGNVLINTTTDAGYKLDVNGNTRINGNLRVNNILGDTGNLVIESANSAAYVQIKPKVGNTDGIRIETDQTDAGTTGEWSSFRVIGPIFSPTTGSRTRNFISVTPIITQTGGANGITRGLHISASIISASDWRAIETTTGSVLFNGGNVGIGTTTPSASLHISGSSGSALLEIDSPAVNNILFVTGSGRVGIGTGTPSATLDVSGSARVTTLTTVNLNSAQPTETIFIRNSGETIAGRIFPDGSILRIASSNGNSTINIFANGNLGINQTTDAGFRLDVNGTARTTGQHTVGTLGFTGGGSTISSIGNSYINFYTRGFRGFDLYNGNATAEAQKVLIGNFATFGVETSRYTAAMLVIESTTKGFLPPRTSTTSNISSPGQGLITYVVTSSLEGLYYYNSGSYEGWTRTLNNSGSQSITGGSLTINKSGSTVLDIQGSQGQLFSVVDALSGSLMSVNDVSGLPILEVFSDDRVVMGTYGAPALTVSGSAVTVATASAAPTGTVPEGTFRFATVGGAYYIYAYLGGAWRSGSLF